MIEIVKVEIMAGSGDLHLTKKEGGVIIASPRETIRCMDDPTADCGNRVEVYLKLRDFLLLKEDQENTYEQHLMLDIYPQRGGSLMEFIFNSVKTPKPKKE